MQITTTPPPDQVALALRALARDMGDPYRMDDATLARLLTESAGTTGAVLASAPGPVGVAVYSLFPSTTRGQIGAFVTDLWVDASHRGTGLGRTLLARVRDKVAARWGATFLRLNYYADNPGAAAFYARLGFAAKPQEIWVTLEGVDLEALA
ncbi:MAG: GNAT family N-acetyltransferase [Paracoccaceae bacterium]|jgi:GNAT superfamily N-acetyltransferase